jgi:DNA-binding PadR family transcriptional regulator
MITGYYSIYILLALTGQPKTAVELATAIAEDSQSVVLIQESTLYKALKRLTDEGLVEPDGRRWQITYRGRDLLKKEKMRLGRMAILLNQRV